jgi:hypothetical protein
MKHSQADLHEASSWWDPQPTTLLLSRAEKVALVEALEFYDLHHPVASAKPGRLRTIAALAELLLRLGV